MLKTPLIAPLSQSLTPSLEDGRFKMRSALLCRLKAPLGLSLLRKRGSLQTHFHGWGWGYFWMAFIRPPAEMMFWIKGGKGSAWNTLPLVSSVMTPVSKST